ncbi:MAG: hypothetical protein E7077_05585 [Bacteroidales bacterium]|jgi:hypothetical protein|nr:hypothetical protein [Bacteroidales bacterium]
MELLRKILSCAVATTVASTINGSREQNIRSYNKSILSANEIKLLDRDITERQHVDVNEVQTVVILGDRFSSYTTKKIGMKKTKTTITKNTT